MESFTITAASGWQTLSSLITAADATDATFSSRFLWSWFYIKNTHATQTVIVKSRRGTTAPTVDSGINLAAAGGNITINPGHGLIDGKSIWIKASGNSTTIDIAFVGTAGLS